MKLKKLVSVLVVCLLMAGICCGCVGDNGKVIEEAPFYSLQAAYNNGYISRRDLRKIDSNLQKKRKLLWMKNKSEKLKQSL